EDGDQLVLLAIKTALAGIGLGPNQKVFPLGVARPRGGEQFGEMPPVDEQIVDRAVAAKGDRLADERCEEGGKGLFRHLARGHLEFSMTHLAPAHRMTRMGTLYGGSVTIICASSPCSTLW